MKHLYIIYQLWCPLCVVKLLILVGKKIILSYFFFLMSSLVPLFDLLGHRLKSLRLLYSKGSGGLILIAEPSLFTGSWAVSPTPFLQTNSEDL